MTRSIDEHMEEFIQDTRSGKSFQVQVEYRRLTLDETIQTVAELEAAIWEIARVRVVIRRNAFLPITPEVIHALNRSLCMSDNVGLWRDAFRRALRNRTQLRDRQVLAANDVTFIRPDGMPARGQTRIKRVVWK